MLDVQEIKSVRPDGDGLDRYRGWDSEYIGRRKLRLERPTERPKRKSIGEVKEDMELVGVREEGAGVRQRQVIRCDGP